MRHRVVNELRRRGAITWWEWAYLQVWLVWYRLKEVVGFVGSPPKEGVGSGSGGERADSPSEREVDGGSRAPDPADASRCPECGHLTIDHGSSGCSECDECGLRDDEIKHIARQGVEG